MSSKGELMEFLKKYPTPQLSIVGTLQPGAFICINPIPTICIAEIMCHKDIYQDVLATIAEQF